MRDEQVYFEVITSVLYSGCRTDNFTGERDVAFHNTDFTHHHRAAMQSCLEIGNHTILRRVIGGTVIEYFPHFHWTPDAIQPVESMAHPPAHGDFISDILIDPAFVFQYHRCGIPDDVFDKVEILLLPQDLRDVGGTPQVKEHENMFLSFGPEIPSHEKTAQVAGPVFVADQDQGDGAEDNKQPKQIVFGKTQAADMLANRRKEIIRMNILLTRDRGTGDKGEDGDEADDQREGQQNKKDGLAVGIVPDPTLQVGDQDGAAKEPGEHGGQRIDQQGGPEGGTGRVDVGGKEYHLIVNGLADREKHPDPGDPEDSLEFTPGPESLQKIRRFCCIGWCRVHVWEVDQLRCKGK